MSSSHVQVKKVILKRIFQTKIESVVIYLRRWNLEHKFMKICCVTQKIIIKLNMKQKANAKRIILAYLFLFMKNSGLNLYLM